MLTRNFFFAKTLLTPNFFFQKTLLTPKKTQTTKL